MKAADVRLDVGWAELRDGRWQAARASFEGAAAEEESPEAFEGLSWAAWWLDDADAVFAARERAYRLYRKRGDAAGAARMATWLAADQLDFRGAAAVAGGWLRRARRLLEPLEPGPDHGWLAFHEGYVAHGQGDTSAARESAALAAELGRRFEVADLEMLGLGLEGAALVASAQVDEGMRRLDEATVTALEDEAAIPISSAWVCCFLVGACTAVRDYQRAFEWCDRIAEFAERYGSRYMLAFCRAEYGEVHLWRGRWTEAEEMLAAAIDDFSSSRPAWVSAPLAELAELRRRQGRAEEAAPLLDEAGASGRALLCRAALALDQGETLRAVELVERLLRQVPEPRKLDRAPALETLARARIARGELEEAASALEELRQVEGLVGTAPLRAAADLVEGMLAAAGGDHERARPLLEDAELVLIHQDEVCVRLLPEQHQKVLASEGDHLVEERLRDRVPQIRLARDGGLQPTEERLVFIENKDDAILERGTLGRGSPNCVRKICRRDLLALIESIAYGVIEEAPVWELTRRLARLANDHGSTCRSAEVDACSRLPASPDAAPEPHAIPLLKRP